MHVDILIFAVIAAFLIYKLNSVLGTRHGGERERPNPFARPPEAPAERLAAPAAAAVSDVPLSTPAPVPAELVDAAANADGRIDTGLAEIAAADVQFDAASFIGGAKYAFEMIVTAYSRGDRDTLRPLLSPKLFKDFSAGIEAREQAGHTSEVTIHRIKAARIIEAHLGGTMAYVTVDFDVEETMVMRDRDGTVIDGNPDRIFSVEDIWTFTRDVRSHDPNWLLIETRAVEK